MTKDDKHYVCKRNGYYVYNRDGHYCIIDIKPIYEKVLFEGTEKECYEFANAKLEDYNEKLLDGDVEKHNKIVELEAQIEKMRKLLEQWYNQHSDKGYTKTFYDKLIKATEDILWSDVCVK